MATGRITEAVNNPSVYYNKPDYQLGGAETASPSEGANTPPTLVLPEFQPQRKISIGEPRVVQGDGSITGTQVFIGTADSQEKCMLLLATDGTADVITLTAGGSGYSDGTAVATSGGTGTGLTLDVTFDDAGAITGGTINTAGTGYTNGDVVTVVGGNNDATFTVTDGGDGIPDSVTLTTGGTGYYGLVNVPTTGGSGTGLTFDITLNAGAVDSVTVNAIGAGYVTGDSVAVADGFGTGATVTLEIFGDGFKADPVWENWYCRESLPTEVDTEVECNAFDGYIWDTGACRVMTFVEADTAATQAACEGAGYYWDGSACVDTATAGNLTVYGEDVCEQFGWHWDGTACTNDVASNYTTQSSCETANFIWIGDTCYDDGEFGDGF